MKHYKFYFTSGIILTGAIMAGIYFSRGDTPSQDMSVSGNSVSENTVSQNEIESEEDETLAKKEITEDPEAVIFPDLIGKGIDAAAQELTGNGILFEVNFEYREDVPEYSVIYQDTPAGELVPYMSWHEITVNSRVEESEASPLQDEKKSMPSMTGLLMEDVILRLSNDGLFIDRVEVTHEIPKELLSQKKYIEDGSIVAQFPAEGETVTTDTKIILTIYISDNV